MPAERIRRLGRDERLARLAGFWWGFAEGLFFFVVPDVYISFVALFSPRAGAVAWLSSIGGSAVAVSAIYLVTVVLGLGYLRFLELIPGISGALLERVGGRLATEGLPYTPFLVFGGVPLKVYGALAFSLGHSLGSVLVWTVFARIVRIAPTFAAAAAVRLLFRRMIDARATVWCALLVGFWVAFYIFYFIRMSRV
ncbi:MAG TPA: hypothetical protein VGQ73_02275 [Gemmatimonadales bacterium]|jgi:hypothetical protein|nr:hypothetical protein [Gemmatimonadales bacterium]